MQVEVQKIMQEPGLVITYGENGQKCVKIKDGYLVTVSQGPEGSNLDKITDVAITTISRDFFANCVYNFLPGSKAKISDDWNSFYKAAYKNEQKNRGKSELSLKTVDVFGVRTSGKRRFIFRKVEGKISELIQNLLNKDVPSIEELKTCVNEAIELSEIDYDYRTAWKELNPIAFYYLPIGEKLKVTFETGVFKVKAKVRPSIFAYPILPDVKKEKIRLATDLLKKQFDKSIDIVSIDVHPIEVKEPPTIREVVKCPK